MKAMSMLEKEPTSDQQLDLMGFLLCIGQLCWGCCI